MTKRKLITLFNISYPPPQHTHNIFSLTGLTPIHPLSSVKPSPSIFQ